MQIETECDFHEGVPQGSAGRRLGGVGADSARVRRSADSTALTVTAVVTPGFESGIPLAAAAAAAAADEDGDGWGRRCCRGSCCWSIE